MAQIAFFETTPVKKLSFAGKISEWGTFKDSLRAPIHNWFTYPAGFSYKAVEHFLKINAIRPGQIIYDPFMGSGTTNIVAKFHGVNSYGMEAHPFVFPITQAKLNWDAQPGEANWFLAAIIKKFRATQRNKNHEQLPELIGKCYEKKTLDDLVRLRDIVGDFAMPESIRGIFFVGLVALLRRVSSAATGWPYIAPNKIKTSSIGKIVIDEYEKTIINMLKDISCVKTTAWKGYKNAVHRIFNADSRDTKAMIPSESIDGIFTSPPYLNNFDYADRTRLEMYFFKEAETWGDITRKVRDRLITSATTQINRADPRYNLAPEIQKSCPEMYAQITDIKERLAALRLTKGGKKSYDLMVTGYFNDMFRQLQDSYRVLKRGSCASYVLGDSAPYGVHVPTDEILGQLAVAVGFNRYDIEILRKRGEKWKANPQRHKVPLRESIVTFYKEYQHGG